MDRSAVVLTILWFFSGFASYAGILSDKADEAKTRNEAFVEGSEGWRFLPAELRFADKLASTDLDLQVEPAVDAIADFAGQLKQAGVSLVVVPVPPKVLVHGAKLQVDGAEELKMREGWLAIMNDLSSRGVDVIDLLADYTSAQELMFCQRDTHWSGLGVASAVGKLVPKLQSAGLEPRTSASNPSWEETSIQGDLGGDRESVKLHFVKGASLQNAKAPVLLLGDSHVLVFHQGGDLHATGAGLPEQLADVLGEMPEVLGVRGSGATSSRITLARTIRSKPDYLENKTLVVWVFAGREFTEADSWRKFSLFPEKAAR